VIYAKKTAEFREVIELKEKEKRDEPGRLWLRMLDGSVQ